jgi:CRP-like cAMP-binding protein
MLGTRSLSERLVHVLMHLADTHGIPEPNGQISVAAAFSHGEIANLIGATRQWVTISLKRMHDKNIVVARKSKIIVRRLDVLQEMRGQED